MSTETQSPTAEFKSVVEDAALDELSKLETKRELLARQLHEVRGQITAVRNVLKAVRPPQQPKTSRARTNGSSAKYPFKMSEERFEQAVEWLKTLDPDEEFYGANIEQALGWSSSYTSGSVHQLRNAGMIRLVRKDGARVIYKATV